MHRMTAEDMQRLALYRQKRGPLNPILRNDAMLAQIAELICIAGQIKGDGGKTLKSTDFAPYLKAEPSKPEEMNVPSIEDLKAAFGVL